MTPHKLEPDEIRTILLRLAATGRADPLNDPLRNVVTTRDDRYLDAMRSGGRRAVEPFAQEWAKLNPDLERDFEEAIHELFVSGLLMWAGRDSPYHVFKVTRLGESALDGTGGGSDGLPDEVADVWKEAYASFNANRMKAAAIVIGVAAEIVIDRLAGRLGAAGRVDKDLGESNNARRRREACARALKDNGWLASAGVTPQVASDALDGLDVMGTLFARVRNEQAHPRSVHLPARSLLYGELMAFGAYARSIEAVLMK